MAAEATDAPKRHRSIVEVLQPEGARGSARDLPQLLGASLRLVWRSGRRELAATALLQVVAAAGVGIQLFVGKDVLAAVLRADGSFGSVLPSLALLVGIGVLLSVARTVESELSRLLAELVGRRALDGVIDVAASVDLLEFERSDFFDRLRRAQSQGTFRSLQIVNGLLGVVGGVVAAAGIVVALVALQPLLLPLVALGYVPLWISSSRNSRDSYGFAWGMTPNDRQRGYLQHLLLDRGTAKEIRAFGLAPFLRRRYDLLYDERIAELRSLAKRRTARSLVGSVASALVTAVSVGGLAWLYVSGRMSLAATGAAVFGLVQLAGRVVAVHFSAASLYESTLFVRDYSSFLAELAEPQPPGPPAPPFERLVLEGVTFAYPDSARPAVEGVSLEVGHGEIVALVGENGSGKTTLAKLIAGLYRPDAGRVLWNGVDVRELDVDDVRSQVAPIFQDFVRYLMTVGDNVAVGRHERADDRQAVETAAVHAGADRFVERLPEGYDTLLGREWLGGFDLSVGQWQLLALARAFFRDASLVLLDEPTAALDARAESQLFERMRDLLEGRAAVLISHRFSSVRSADRIYVLEHGRVVEHGSHEELVALDGRYAELFALQAAAYQKSTLR